MKFMESLGDIVLRTPSGRMFLVALFSLLVTSQVNAEVGLALFYGGLLACCFVSTIILEINDIRKEQQAEIELFRRISDTNAQAVNAYIELLKPLAEALEKSREAAEKARSDKPLN
jgi:hypothetical protein